MHAISFATPGPPSVLRWTEVEDPASPGPGDVVIRVHAAGVNNADIMQRQGKYPVPAGASPILGLECAGTITRVGADVDGWAVGDRVCALLTGGGYAEQVVVPAEQLLTITDSLSYSHAASLPEAACTVYSNLAMTAGLRAGGSVLVHGGGSGIGTLAIQWAKALGATVLTTAGSTRKLERCAELGADVTINYHDQDFLAEVLANTNGAGVDAILDLVGSRYLDRNVRSLALDGHLVVIGLTGAGGDSTLDLPLLLSKRASVSATTLRSRPAAQKAAIVAAVRENLWPCVEDGRIAPVIDREVPIARAADAHQLLAEGNTIGKIVLTVD
ncbi:MAG: NADPH:quinone oxidoreductase [Glaciihabitans sp.]|nr:NADPH:quinone oxidoreductase [Glaciihabitans sp.]